ncbi:hypothetical protein PN498_18830 [Oscillatoria sp. CS-180]|uniref:hypothetical protein n=1 Tax=Oscillatoria sp. CS-180 TaxID=3021720 RepID=UPI00232C6883|nr:hypothetical protein [Oscillatoria sp. CS-180]MDB9528057.1 hypothetical protein [Oscillatoria sp. CS-180]
MPTTMSAQPISFHGPDIELIGELFAVHIQREVFGWVDSVRVEVRFEPETFEQAIAEEAFFLHPEAFKGDLEAALNRDLPVDIELGLPKADWQYLSADIVSAEQLGAFLLESPPDSLLRDIDTWFAWTVKQADERFDKDAFSKSGLSTIWSPQVNSPRQGSLMQDLAVGLAYAGFEHELQSSDAFFVEMWTENGTWVCAAIVEGRTVELRSVLPAEIDKESFESLQEVFSSRDSAELGGAFELSAEDQLLTFGMRKTIDPEPLPPRAVQALLEQHRMAFDQHIPTLESILGPIFEEETDIDDR